MMPRHDDPLAIDPIEMEDEEAPWFARIIVANAARGAITPPAVTIAMHMAQRVRFLAETGGLLSVEHPDPPDVPHARLRANAARAVADLMADLRLATGREPA